MSTKDKFFYTAQRQRGILIFFKGRYISCSVTRCQFTIFMFDASRMVRFTFDSKVE